METHPAAAIQIGVLTLHFQRRPQMLMISPKQLAADYENALEMLNREIAAIEARRARPAWKKLLQARANKIRAIIADLRWSWK
jgi:RNA polymerase-interacting CarD/CdnL/TRCF family regulator